MERLSGKDILGFNIRMLKAVGSGLLRLLQERINTLSMEGNPYAGFIDHDHTDEEAARIQDVIQGINSPPIERDANG